MYVPSSNSINSPSHSIGKTLKNSSTEPNPIATNKTAPSTMATAVWAITELTISRGP